MSPYMLYEGNFDEWLPTMEARILQGGRWRRRYGPGENDRAARWTASDVMSYVRTSVLSRLPDSCQRDVRLLMPQLQGIAQPFRFLELPPEIRNCIYELILTEPEPINLFTTRTIGLPSIVSYSKQPHFAFACRQLRHEVLNAYYGVNSFLIILGLEETVCLEHMHFEDIAFWATRNWRWMSGIRSLKISLCTKYVPDFGSECFLSLEVRYLPEEGLVVRIFGAPARGCKVVGEKISKRLEDLQSFVNDHGIKGQAVAMFFTNGEAFWERLMHHGKIGAVPTAIKRAYKKECDCT